MNCSNPQNLLRLLMQQVRPANKYDAKTYKYWKTQIDDAEKYREKFVTKGDNIIKRYRDEDRVYDGERRYNILYSNTETLQPVVYSSKPSPDVSARDLKNVSARKGGEMIEKGISYYLGYCDFDDKARLAVTDFLLAGQGVMRPKYKPLYETIEQIVQPLDVKEGDDVTEKDGVFIRKVEQVVFEEIDFEYVHWKDFLYPDCNCWDELPWVAFRTYMTMEEAVEAFGEKKAGLLTYEVYKTEQNRDLDDMKAASGGQKKAKVYEIWDKGYRQQLFFSESINNTLLEINDDPLELESFFPVPKPMFSITTSGTLLPVPFYLMYQDQAMELDDINSRICAMVDNMKRRGFYNANIGELANLSSMGDNEFWPVKDWNEFANKGGLNGALQVEDVSTYANVLVILVQQRQQLLEDIYQIIGISDIRRAQTDPRETLGAQQMKSRYGTIRISTYQRKVAEFMRDLLKICGEIIINQFEPETVAMITNMPLDTKVERDDNGEIVKAEVGVIDLLTELRSKKPSDIIVDIETDSTIVEDIEGQKKDLLDITSALAEFTGIAEPLAGVIGIDATANLLMSIVERFKLGRNIQQQVQDHVDKMKVKLEAQEDAPPPPTPEETIAQMELQKKAMELQFEQQQLEANSRIKLAELGIKQQINFLKAKELDANIQMDSQLIDLKAVDGMLKFEALKIEAKNSKDNAVVGV